MTDYIPTADDLRAQYLGEKVVITYARPGENPQKAVGILLALADSGDFTIEDAQGDTVDGSGWLRVEADVE